MTYYKLFADKIIEANQYIKKVFVCIIVGGILNVILTILPQYDWVEFLLLPTFIFLMYFLFKFINKIFYEFKCPKCSNKLSHLITDFSYTKKLLITGLPSNIPKDIDCCPYCKVSFKDEINL